MNEIVYYLIAFSLSKLILYYNLHFNFNEKKYCLFRIAKYSLSYLQVKININSDINLSQFDNTIIICMQNVGGQNKRGKEKGKREREAKCLFWFF